MDKIVRVNNDEYEIVRLLGTERVDTPILRYQMAKRSY